MTTLCTIATHCTLCPRQCGADAHRGRGRAAVGCPTPPWSPAPPCTIGRNRRSPAPKEPGPFSSPDAVSAAFSARTTASAKTILAKPVSVARLAGDLLRADRRRGPQHRPGESHPLRPRRRPSRWKTLSPSPWFGTAGAMTGWRHWRALEGKIQIYLPDLQIHRPGHRPALRRSRRLP